MKREDVAVFEELFDKKLVRIILIFLEHPEKHFSISQISHLSKTNLASTFRLVNKLLSKDIIKIDFSGKWKNYSLEDNEKTRVLQQTYSDKFIEVRKFAALVSIYPQLKEVIFFRKNSEEEVKIILVGNRLPSKKIRQAASDIQKGHRAKISYMELSEEGYKELKEILPLI